SVRRVLDRLPGGPATPAGRERDRGPPADARRRARHARGGHGRDHQRLERGRVLLRPRIDLHRQQGVGDVLLGRTRLRPARVRRARHGAVPRIHAHRVPRPGGSGEVGSEGDLAGRRRRGQGGAVGPAPRAGRVGAGQAVQVRRRRRKAVATRADPQARRVVRGARPDLIGSRARLRTVATPSLDQAAKSELARLVTELCVVHGKVTLASGAEADYYIDLRRATLHHAAAPLIGTLLRQLTADWSYVSVGGLTLGADPVATSMLHSAASDGMVLDAFVVRKNLKEHGMQRRIEGMEVAGQRVLAVEDTSTTGGSVLTAVEALNEAGATVVGVATVVDRATGAREAIEAAGLEYRYLLDLDDLGLTSS